MCDCAVMVSSMVTSLSEASNSVSAAALVESMADVRTPACSERGRFDKVEVWPSTDNDELDGATDMKRRFSFSFSSFEGSISHGERYCAHRGNGAGCVRGSGAAFVYGCQRTWARRLRLRRAHVLGLLAKQNDS